MDIVFNSTKLNKKCNDKRHAIKEWGPRQGELVMLRLDQLRAAAVLDDMRNTPGRCHELTANRAGQLSLDLVHPDRLIFTPEHDPVPQKPDGGLDWTKVTVVRIHGVEDTHE